MIDSRCLDRSRGRFLVDGHALRCSASQPSASRTPHSGSQRVDFSLRRAGRSACPNFSIAARRVLAPTCASLEACIGLRVRKHFRSARRSYPWLGMGPVRAIFASLASALRSMPGAVWFAVRKQNGIRWSPGWQLAFSAAELPRAAARLQAVAIGRRKSLRCGKLGARGPRRAARVRAFFRASRPVHGWSVRSVPRFLEVPPDCSAGQRRNG